MKDLGCHVCLPLLQSLSFPHQKSNCSFPDTTELVVLFTLANKQTKICETKGSNINWKHSIKVADHWNGLCEWNNSLSEYSTSFWSVSNQAILTVKITNIVGVIRQFLMIKVVLTAAEKLLVSMVSSLLIQRLTGNCGKETTVFLFQKWKLRMWMIGEDN